MMSSQLEIHVHNGYAWAGMGTIDADKRWSKALVFAGADHDYRGQLYPPIEWETICRAFKAAGEYRNITCGLPQVWTGSFIDSLRVVGTVWEICAKYEWGEFSGDQAVMDLVCAVHQHLGKYYPDFVKI